MTAIGGSIETVTLDGREFAVTADADVARKVGGYENEVLANGDGTVRLIKTRVPFQKDGLVLTVDDSNGDHEFLQELADRKDLWPLTATYASGVVWQGTGQIVGEFAYSNQTASATVSLAGEGKLTRQ